MAMPKVQSSVYPDRAISFNEWQQDLKFERDLNRKAEQWKSRVVEAIRNQYYNSKNSVG